MTEARHIRAIPVVAFALRDALVVGTDAGEWLKATGTELVELPATGPFGAAIRDADEVVVASWEPTLLRLRDGAWLDHAIGAPALALATVAHGLAIGDESGLSLLATGGSVPIQEVASPAPIVDLVGLGDGLAALTATGVLGVTRWPGEPGPFVAIGASAIGRPHAVFRGIQSGTALVAGARGVAVLNGSQLSAVATELPERICGAAVFGNTECACLCDDAGGCWIVDRNLNHVRVRLPRTSVVGVIAGGDDCLAWTSDGALYVIQPDGSSFRLAERDVVLAMPEPAPPHRGIAIHWTAASGARVSRGHVAWT